MNKIPENYALPLHLFHQGTNLMAYDFLGCHKGEKDGKKASFSESGRRMLKKFQS